MLQIVWIALYSPWQGTTRHAYVRPQLLMLALQFHCISIMPKTPPKEINEKKETVCFYSIYIRYNMDMEGTHQSLSATLHLKTVEFVGFATAATRGGQNRHVLHQSLHATFLPLPSTLLFHPPSTTDSSWFHFYTLFLFGCGFWGQGITPFAGNKVYQEFPSVKFHMNAYIT